MSDESWISKDDGRELERIKNQPITGNGHNETTMLNAQYLLIMASRRQCGDCQEWTTAAPLIWTLFPG